MEKIRLGVIGCGGMARTHAKGLNACMDTVEVTAVCDVVEERAREVAAVLNDPYVATDYRNIVDMVDAVLVVLPHDLHFECGMFFARHKKHVLMEKPLCNSEEECLRLIETCEEENVVLMCAYPVRFWPGIVKMKELIDSGDYGKVIQMSVWTEQLTMVDELRCTARSGGGQLFSHGCHYIDLMLWFLGNPVVGAHIGTKVGTPWLLKEGTSAVTMLFESGAIGYHGATWGARGTRLGYDFQVMTERGLLEYDHNVGEVRLYDKHAEHKPGEERGSQDVQILWTREGEKSKYTQFEVRHFIDCIQTGMKPLTDGRSALQGLRVIWKLYDAEAHHTMADLRGLGLSEAN